VTADTGGVKYLVLADRAAPYLLARVRWPDVAQAITANCPDWLDDPGLFDLPYDRSSVPVSFAQAASVAAGWGRQLRTEPAGSVPSLVRRMPANWSDLTPAERHAWGLESVRRRRLPARRLRRLRSSQAKTDTAESAAGPGNGPAGDLGSAASERRRQPRVRVDGRAHIQSGSHTMSAALVDLSEGGVRCVLPDAPLLLGPGARLGGPFLLEAEVTTSRICLDVPGWISWNRSMRAGTHFGVVFGALTEGETEGVQRFAIAAGRGRGSR
jgi:PilZ domain-containing protein